MLLFLPSVTMNLQELQVMAIPYEEHQNYKESIYVILGQRKVSQEE